MRRLHRLACGVAAGTLILSATTLAMWVFLRSAELGIGLIQVAYRAAVQ